MIIIAITLSTVNQLSLFLVAYIHCRKIATRGYSSCITGTLRVLVYVYFIAKTGVEDCRDLLENDFVFQLTAHRGDATMVGRAIPGLKWQIFLAHKRFRFNII